MASLIWPAPMTTTMFSTPCPSPISSAHQVLSHALRLVRQWHVREIANRIKRVRRVWVERDKQRVEIRLRRAFRGDEFERLSQRAVTCEAGEVRVPADGVQALAIAQEFAPQIGLLDTGMPRMDGYEAAPDPLRRRFTDRARRVDRLGDRSRTSSAPTRLASIITSPSQSNRPGITRRVVGRLR
jgi:CheY-like chemotaxis protein